MELTLTLYGEQHQFPELVDQHYTQANMLSPNESLSQPVNITFVVQTAGVSTSPINPGSIYISSCISCLLVHDHFKRRQSQKQGQGKQVATSPGVLAISPIGKQLPGVLGVRIPGSNSKEWWAGALKRAPWSGNWRARSRAGHGPPPGSTRGCLACRGLPGAARAHRTAG